MDWNTPGLSPTTLEVCSAQGTLHTRFELTQEQSIFFRTLSRPRSPAGNTEQ